MRRPSSRPTAPGSKIERLSAIYADEAAAGVLLRAADELRAVAEQQAGEADKQAAIDRLRSQDLPVVSASEWISNPYYTGGYEVWPKIRDLFVEIVESKKTVIVLRGAAGWGKTTLARSLIGRTAYEVGCYASPHTSIGQFSPWRPLRISLMSTDKDKAMEHSFHPIAGMIRRSSWFGENFRAQQRLYNGTGVNFLAMSKPGSKDITLRISPDPTTPDEIVGDDVVAALMTECNKYDFVESSRRARADSNQRIYDVAMEIYRELLNRLTTRFYRPYEPCVRLIFDSSERYEEDFISRLVPQLKESGIPYGVYSFSNWQTRPGMDKPPYFWFAKPKKGSPAEIIETEQRRIQLLSLDREIIQVPEGPDRQNYTLAKQFPDDFAQNHVGAPTDAVSRFIGDPEALDRCRTTRTRWLSEHGIHDYREPIPDRFMLGHTPIDWSAICRVDELGVSRPLILPTARRFAHFDLATTGDDFVGFAMGCAAGQQGDRPIVWVDLAVRIERTDKEYDFDKLRSLIIDLKRNGFVFEQISFDSWQSFDFGQQLQQGYSLRVERISLHATIDGYISLRDALYQQRLLLDANIALATELVQLERRLQSGKEKVGHRPGGHDDTADALAGIVWEIGKAGNSASTRHVARAITMGNRGSPVPLAISPGTPEYDAAITKAAQEALRKQQRSKDREERRSDRLARRAARKFR